MTTAAAHSAPSSRASDEGAVDGPVFGIVISTIGRVPELRALLESLAMQTRRCFRVSVCAQGSPEAVAKEVEAFARRANVPAHVVIGGPPGVAAGRNRAARELREEVDYLLFPNDTSLLPPDLLEQLGSRLGNHDAGGIALRQATGLRVSLPPVGTPLDNRTVWSVVGPGLVLHRRCFELLGGFGEDWGTGAGSPWQSGEETDLLLRLRQLRPLVRFLWMPDLEIGARNDSAGLSVRERRRKLRAYGRGYGRILRVHGYGPGWWARAVASATTFGLRHRNEYQALDGWWVLVGRLEGLLGVTASRQAKAVSR